MFKNNRRRFAALLMAAVMLLGTHAALGIESAPEISTAALSLQGSGINHVEEYLRSRGLTREDIGLPPAGTTFAPGLPGAAVASAARPLGGFAPSTVVTHAELRRAIQSHAAVAPSVVGWLVVPNTNINVPININRNNNNHYLYRTWRGVDYTGRLYWRNWSQFPDTAVYLDFRTVLGDSWATSSRNMTLYGHNWNNLRAPFRIGNHAQDRMFAQLKSYKCIDFAGRNPHVYFSTNGKEGIWRIFAVGYAHTTPLFNFNAPNPNREQRTTLIEEWRARTHFHFNVPVDADDTLLTFSTCTRHHGATETQRFVVVARLLRPGETENDTVTVTRNQNIRHPDFTQPLRLPPAAPAAPATPAAPVTAVPATPGTALAG